MLVAIGTDCDYCIILDTISFKCILIFLICEIDCGYWVWQIGLGLGDVKIVILINQFGEIL